MSCAWVLAEGLLAGCDVADDALRLINLAWNMLCVGTGDGRDGWTLLCRVHVVKEHVAVENGAMIAGG